MAGEASDHSRRLWPNWNQLASGFTTRANEVGGMVVCFEELIKDDGVVQQIEQYLQMPLDRSVLQQKVGSQPHNYKVSLIGVAGTATVYIASLPQDWATNFQIFSQLFFRIFSCVVRSG